MRMACLAILLPFCFTAAHAAVAPPRGWTLEGWQAEKYYDVGTEAAAPGKAATSAFLRAGRDGVPPSGVMQMFSAQQYAGKRIHFSGMLRTAQARDARLFMTVSRDGKAMLTGRSDPVSGTRDWRRYDIVLDVPRDASLIKIGFALEGQGTVWASDFAFSEAEAGLRTTHGDRPRLPECFESANARPTVFCILYGAMNRLDNR